MVESVDLFQERLLCRKCIYAGKASVPKKMCLVLRG